MSEEEARRLLREMVENYDAKKNLQEIISELVACEAEFGMSTLHFYPQFIAGQLGDSKEFMRWASLYEAYVELTQPHLIAKAAA